MNQPTELNTRERLPYKKISLKDIYAKITVTYRRLGM